MDLDEIRLRQRSNISRNLSGGQQISAVRMTSSKQLPDLFRTLRKGYFFSGKSVTFT
jgi:hypothetical protein